MILTLFLSVGCKDSVDLFGYTCNELKLDENSQTAQTNLPNILLIVVDDLGYHDFDIYSVGVVKSGAGMQVLMDDGYIFSHAYVTSPVCAPSRAGLITGQHQNAFGFVSNITNDTRNSLPQELYGLPSGKKTIAERVKSYGYKTGLIGKWHLGEHEKYHPSHYGFDQFFGFLDGHASYINPFITIDSGAPELFCDYMTDLLTNATINYVNRNLDSPFFAYLSYSAPHTPHEVKNAFAGDPYTFILSNLDQNLSRLINHLKEVGVYDNTLIFFISDNGCPTSSTTCNSGIFRGGKASMYEGGIRVPFIMKLPNSFSVGANRTISQTVSSLDIAPTIEHIINGHYEKTKDFHGISLLKQLEFGFDTERSLYFTSAIIKGDYKFIRNFEELYNLRDDPMESINLINEYPEIADSLSNEHKKWSTKNPPKLW